MYKMLQSHLMLLSLVLEHLRWEAEFHITDITGVLAGATVPHQVVCELLRTVKVLPTVGAIEQETP